MIVRLSWLHALLLLLATASCADAFVFDVWQSGMKINQVIEAGKEKGLSVVLDSGGFSFFGKQEPDELAVKVEYRCETRLMGYGAKILGSATI